MIQANKHPQLIAVVLSILLFIVLFFGFDTKTSIQVDLEKSRSLNFEATDARNLIAEATGTVSEETAIVLEELITALEHTKDESERIKLFMELSGHWNRLNRPDIAGHYMLNAAELKGDARSWSMAGTTFAQGLKVFDSGKERAYCMDNAISCFENALSMDPLNTDHRINLALCYVEEPPIDNPMKGILMLRDLNSTEPKNIKVLSTLGSLAIRTGQYSKAIERLSLAFDLSGNDSEIACLLTEAYKGLNDIENEKRFAAICKIADD